MTTLLTRLRSFPHWVAVGFLGMAVVMLTLTQCERRRHSEREGELTERLRALATERDTLRTRAARRDTVYQRDTVKLTGTVTRFRTLVDSLVRTDTLTVRESVLVAAADTLIQACRATITTCEQRVADRDRIIANERATRATADALFRVRLAQANPRLLPYVEARVNPLDTRLFVATGGLEARLLGRIRAVGAAEYRTQADHPLAFLAGIRITF
jgi:hypothetical protein